MILAYSKGTIDAGQSIGELSNNSMGKA